MKNRVVLACCLALLSFTAFTQTQIDGSFPFQTDPDKKYTLIVPSGYSDAVPTKVMLGLHPFNTSRWSGKTWCEYLVDFAEANNLLLVCPDGGTDGKIDDPIDQDFTSALLDSIGIWYTLQEDKMYAMGFSWGGRTTYTYGLANTDRLHGFMPIGAAMSGVNIDALAGNADGQPFYFIHGANDNPGSNFSPYKDLLEDNGAITNSKVLPGVGHTIDFANNMAILTEAYIWIDSVNCDTSTISGFNEVLKVEKNWVVAPNPVVKGQDLSVVLPERFVGEIIFKWYNIQGQLIQEKTVRSLNNNSSAISFPTNGLDKGIYFLIGQNKTGILESRRIIVR